MIEQIAIDYLILANHVEAINGLLYISGGGWTDHYRQIAPNGQIPISHIGIGLSVMIPWNETNKPHRLTVTIEDEDGQSLLTAEAQMSIGRPPKLSPGTEQHAVLSMPLNLVFPHPGGYRIVVRLGDGEDAEVRTWAFQVHDMPAPQHLNVC